MSGEHVKLLEAGPSNSPRTVPSGGQASIKRARERQRHTSKGGRPIRNIRCGVLSGIEQPLQLSQENNEADATRPQTVTSCHYAPGTPYAACLRIAITCARIAPSTGLHMSMATLCTAILARRNACDKDPSSSCPRRPRADGQRALHSLAGRKEGSAARGSRELLHGRSDALPSPPRRPLRLTGTPGASRPEKQQRGA